MNLVVQMRFRLIPIVYVVLFTNMASSVTGDLPTLYEYYTGSGIISGLSDNQTNFLLNGKEISVYSGALHYFRVHPKYWKDRLRKLRAAGLNTVETYVPWNLHQPNLFTFDFGHGESDFTQFLDIVSFIKLAQEEDLLVIVRPGPYICAEWEYGGLPSWLLRYKDMKIRTSDMDFIQRVDAYYSQLFNILAPLQFTRGGPIIAFQIENEYGNTKNDDKPYLQTLMNIMKDHGAVELLFTSDTPATGFSGTLPGVLATANFQDNAKEELKILKEYQPNKPLMVMEYWTGWFDHWSEKHHTRTADAFAEVLEQIITLNSSFNLYMFHGGTNWGLLNGANIKDLSTDNGAYQPDTTSYDYDAPLSENGDYGHKYFKVKELMEKYCTVKLRQPSMPQLVDRVAYPTLNITAELKLNDLIEQSRYVINSKTLLPMELLNINLNSGQSYGYITYRLKNINIPSNSTLKIEGRVCDTVLVLINGELKSKILKTQEDLNEFGYWRVKDSILQLGNEEYSNATLDLVVENWGRNNYGKLNQFNQHKGLWQGNVLINNEVMENFQIIPLEFKKEWTESLDNWKAPTFENGPTLYRAVFKVENLVDTYIDLRDWDKGIVIVNGFVLTRYLRLGPQQCAYLPAPLLKQGENVILIYEHFVPSKTITFAKNQIYETL